MLSMAQRSCRHPGKSIILDDSSHWCQKNQTTYHNCKFMILSEWKPKNSCKPKSINHAVMLLGWKWRPFRFEADEVLGNVQVLCNTKSLIIATLPAFQARDPLCGQLTSNRSSPGNFPTELPWPTFWKKVLVNASFLAAWELEILTFGRLQRKLWLGGIQYRDDKQSQGCPMQPLLSYLMSLTLWFYLVTCQQKPGQYDGGIYTIRYLCMWRKSIVNCDLISLQHQIPGV